MKFTKYLKIVFQNRPSFHRACRKRVKQLGIPTWFMTLSCADLRWPELFQIIAITKGNNMADEEVEALSYHERCSMLNLNPVIVAKHFQYGVETFLGIFCSQMQI
jgi:hypothetical protein